MELFIQILSRTPAYVWVLLTYLVWQGVQSTRTRQQSIWRLCVVPVVLGLAGIHVLFSTPVDGIRPMLAWLAAIVLLIPAGWWTGPRLLSVDRAQSRVTRAGSMVPLVRNLVIFAAHYGLAVGLALRPDRSALLAMLGCAVSGASLGYSGGWMLAFWRAFRASGTRRH